MVSYRCCRQGSSSPVSGSTMTNSTRLIETVLEQAEELSREWAVA